MVSAAVVLALVLASGAFAAAAYFGLVCGIRRSDALTGGSGFGQDVNILVMGLDSRLDENGKPLSQQDYQALHSGNSSDGGYNSNVLMVLHVPKGGGQTTAVSIPRDDWVSIPGSPDGMSHGKVKQAYGFAMDQAMRTLQASPGGRSASEIYQQARDAGRKAEIKTVEQFLNIRIDHFVEITMAAFLDVARALAPITVCLQEATKDSYSGADFKKGVQQLDAQQAVAFVRQRRDTSGSGLALSDLDRERRQQAFIASLLHQLRQTSTLTDVGKIQGLLNAVKDKIAVDRSLNLVDFAFKAKQLASGHISFVTLPILRFGWSSTGESVNIVDRSALQAEVARLFSPPPTSTPNPSPSQAHIQQGPPPAQQAPAAQSPGAQGGPSQPSSAPTYNAGNWASVLQSGGIPCVR